MTNTICRALLACVLLLGALAARAQETDAPGRSIGHITTIGNLVVLEMNRPALARSALFDLAGRSLRFTPGPGGYRVHTEALQWDAEYGPELTGAEVTLHRFTFPFSDRRWTSFLVGSSGSIRFGRSERDIGFDPYGKRDGGISLDRFAQLSEAASALIDSAPAICVFLKPRLTGVRYEKELPDRVVITWDLTEPFGGILDFHWTRTIDRFQAVLHSDGSIEMSYKQLSARDAIVGVYPTVGGAEQPIANLDAGSQRSLPAHLDLQTVKLSVAHAVLLRVTFSVRGGLPSQDAAAIEGAGYRIRFAARSGVHHTESAVTWTVKGMRDPYNPTSGPPQYVVFGPGAFSNVNIRGNSLTISGVLPSAILGAGHVSLSAAAIAGNDDRVIKSLGDQLVSLASLRDPDVHFAALSPSDGPFPVAYQAFHYAAAPASEDLSCTVIRALGDRFDFLVYYADFRIDNQEASSPSFGPAAGNVSGIGQTAHNPATYCSAGRFQWGFAQPVSVDANETWEEPPSGAPADDAHDLGHYRRTLDPVPADGKPKPYDYAMSHIGHEIAHRWVAYVSARVGDRLIPLGPWPHWDPGLQAAVAFPYEERIEASTIGGGVWQGNPDGTYTRLRDGYFVPATGYSYLDLYLMGFVSPAEVPGFFILDSLSRAGTDSNGRAVFKARRTRLTIQDVTAAEGPRLPDAAHSQRRFNTGFVLLVEDGHGPSPELLRRVNGIRRQWMTYWVTTTGHRASMTSSPR